MKLRYTALAAAELDAVLDHIGQRSPSGALSVKQRVQATIALLLQHPKVGKSTSRPELRQIVVQPFPYLIYYQTTTDEIVIHGVRHGARRPRNRPPSPR